jgi:phosphoribulokinase
MSIKNPIIAVTGSSGAGTTSVTRSFQHIFRREQLNAAIIEGDSFHRYDRLDMREKIAEKALAGDHHFSHFGAEANLLAELEGLFREYGESGRGKSRHYVHDDLEAERYGSPPGTFTAWSDLPANTDLSSTKGCMVPRVPTRSTSGAMSTCASASCRSSTSNGSRSSIATRRSAATRRKR